MDKAYASLLSRHETILNHWDRLEPGPAGPSLAGSRLRRSRVLLIAHGPVGYLVAANLTQLPLQSVSLLGLHDGDVHSLLQLSQQSNNQAQQVNVPASRFDIPGFSLTLAKHHLLVVAGGRPQPALLASVNQDCLRIGIAWTQVALWGAEITLGPTIMPGITACYHCYTRRYLANVEHEDVYRARDDFLRNNPTFEFQGQVAPLLQLAAAYFTAEIGRFLTGAQPPVALSRAVTYYPLSQSQAYDYVVPLEWCPVCYSRRVAAPDQPGYTLADVVQRVGTRKEAGRATG